MSIPRILIIAGSDSSGGAGIQADIKTVTALGGYAATAITALTAQNTQGVQAIYDVPADFIAQQMHTMLDDIGADAIKTGMLCNQHIIETVAATLDAYRHIPCVVDPVMVAKGGAPLLAPAALSALIALMMPKATIITPNIPEAALLTGQVIDNVEDMQRAARALLSMGAQAVLLKGGHAQGDVVHDVLVSAQHQEVFSAQRIDTHHTHGTGCTLATALAVGLGQGRALVECVKHARDYVRGAIAHAPGFGTGHGPLHHGWALGHH